MLGAFLDRYRELGDQNLPQLLTLRQVAVLAGITDVHPAPARVRTLATVAECGKPAITRAIDTFVQLRLVERKRDPKDGRDVLIALTERGVKLVCVLFGAGSDRVATQGPAR